MSEGARKAYAVLITKMLSQPALGMSPALDHWALTGVNQMIKYPSVTVGLAMRYDLSFRLDECHWSNTVSSAQ